MAARKYTKEQEARLQEALAALQNSPAFAPVITRLRENLEDVKDTLVTNETSKVPHLQGRAQQLIDTIELLTRKPS